MAETAMAGTAVTHAPLVPEVKLHLVPPGGTLEAFRVQYRHRYGAAPPYWAVAWPGGQGLARFLLDHPEHVRNKSVVDIGCGSGLAAIAAARAGAAPVYALDRDPHAIAATKLNSCINGVFLEAAEAELETALTMGADVALAGDLWYERFDARRATAVLRRLAATGTHVLIADTGRAHFPRRDIEPLASNTLAASLETERAGEITVGVWRLLPHAGDA